MLTKERSLPLVENRSILKFVRIFLWVIYTTLSVSALRSVDGMMIDELEGIWKETIGT